MEELYFLSCLPALLDATKNAVNIGVKSAGVSWWTYAGTFKWLIKHSEIRALKKISSNEICIFFEVELLQSIRLGNAITQITFTGWVVKYI